jgi:hypothetical protein
MARIWSHNFTGSTEASEKKNAVDGTSGRKWGLSIAGSWYMANRPPFAPGACTTNVSLNPPAENDDP